MAFVVLFKCTSRLSKTSSDEVPKELCLQVESGEEVVAHLRSAPNPTGQAIFHLIWGLLI